MFCKNDECSEYDNSFKNNCKKFRDIKSCVGNKFYNVIVSGEKETLKNPFDYQVGGDHYKKNKDICAMDVAEFGMRHKLDPGEYNVIRYTFRHEDKGGIEDLRKANQYLKFIAYIKYDENL